MNLDNILKDKNLKPKEKTELMANGLLIGAILVEELIEHAAFTKDAEKATCIEAFEFATKQKPEIGTEKLLVFVTENLYSKAPRVKWESAKVIGNISAQFPKKLENAIAGLLINAGDKGTVIRWSAAFALSEILKIKTKHNQSLLAKIEAIVEKEEKNSIKKIYLAAIKKLNG